jgi:hypothetical protein
VCITRKQAAPSSIAGTLDDSIFTRNGSHTWVNT